MKRWFGRTLLIAALIAASLAGASIAGADHSWDGNHWASSDLSPTAVDKTSSSLYDVPAAVQEWAALGTAIQPAITGGSTGDITVSEGFSVFWLGQARIWIENGHITKGEVKLNTRLISGYAGAAAVADHVLCQELGHILGLDHNRDGAVGGSPDDTCMNDAGHLGEYTTPNGHDTGQLNLIYDGHEDATGGDSTGGGGPPCSKNPNHPNCQQQQGQWIVVHEFPAP